MKLVRTSVERKNFSMYENPFSLDVFAIYIYIYIPLFWEGEHA